MKEKEKQGYVMYKSWNPIIKSIPDEKAGKLFKAVAAFQDGEAVELSDPLLYGIFQMMEKSIGKALDAALDDLFKDWQ